MHLIIKTPQGAYGEYPVSPSAFQQIEWPLRKLHHWCICVIRNEIPSATQVLPKIMKHTKNAFESIKHRKYPQADIHLKAVLIHTSKLLYPYVKALSLNMTGLAITPLILCCTPFTLLADIMSGITEVNHAFKKGYPKEHIDLILKKKWSASTVQHCSFFAINALFFYFSNALSSKSLNQYVFTVTKTLFMFNLTLVITGILYYIYHQNIEKINKRSDLIARSCSGLQNYRFSILLTMNYLPKWTRPDRFTIFYDETKADESHDFYSIWLDQNREVDDKWQNYAALESKKLIEKNDNPDFRRFLNQFKAKVSPIELLELPKDYTQDALKKAYSKWSLILHPDKNKADPAAEILFKALVKAHDILLKKN